LSQVESFKFQCSAIIEDVQLASSIDLLNAMDISGLQEVYPNIVPHTPSSCSYTCTCELRFSKLKLIKTISKIIYIYVSRPTVGLWVGIGLDRTRSSISFWLFCAKGRKVVTWKM